MSKAKELAREILQHKFLSFNQADLLMKLSELVLSEPEPEPLRGWIEIEVEADIHSRYLLNLVTGNKLIEEKNGGLYGCYLWFTEGGDTQYFKESYDEIKQKIKEAS